MRFLTLNDLDCRGRLVLVREDLNVPMKDGKVADDTRLVATLPTLRQLQGEGARVIVCSHLGRPDGKRDAKYSLRPVGVRLAELLGSDVAFADDCVGPTAEAAVRNLSDGQILLLENVRFHPEEEKNDPGFSRELAGLAER
ncbi:MAG: phosphoglycerate kinase, partial [Vulcanimicrobiaceae bacterium]